MKVKKEEEGGLEIGFGNLTRLETLFCKMRHFWLVLAVFGLF